MICTPLLFVDATDGLSKVSNKVAEMEFEESPNRRIKHKKVNLEKNVVFVIFNLKNKIILLINVDCDLNFYNNVLQIYKHFT